MAAITSINSYKEKKQYRLCDEKWEQHKAAANNTDGSFETDMQILISGGEFVSASAMTEAGKKFEKTETALKEDFYKRYSDTLQSAPDIPSARIQYFCQIMSMLLPAATREYGTEKQMEALSDFGEFYTEADTALSLWLRADKAADSMMDSFYETAAKSADSWNKDKACQVLDNILSCSAEKTDFKTQMLQQMANLFYAYHWMLDDCTMHLISGHA